MSQGAIVQPFIYPGVPPAALKAPNGSVCYNSAANYASYLMVAGTWTLAGGAGGGTPTGTGNPVLATSPTIVTPTVTGRLTITGIAVAALPAAAAGNLGARATVTDANAALTAGIGAVVAAGGANVVPVFSDGAAWRIG